VNPTEEYLLVAEHYRNAANVYAEHLAKMLDEHPPNQGHIMNLGNQVRAHVNRLVLVKEAIAIAEPSFPLSASPSDLDQEPPEPIEPTYHPSPSRRKKHKAKQYGKHAPLNARNKMPIQTDRDTKRRQQANRQKALRDEHKDGCTGKRKFEYQEAIDAAQKVLGQTQVRRMAIYLCFKCGYHHTTKSVSNKPSRFNTQVAVVTESGVTRR
jgi:hypothetical protein